jgi:hypothetical protein
MQGTTDIRDTPHKGQYLKSAPHAHLSKTHVFERWYQRWYQ